MSNVSRRTLVSSVAALPVFAIPAVALEPDGFDRAAISARAEQMVEFLSTRYVRAGWSFDQQRAARFLDAIRTVDLTSEYVSQKDVEINAEINSWVSDHGQSLDWLFFGSIGAMICGMAAGHARVT